MHSCIYEGWVRHQRFRPVEHSFRNKLFLMYLDLDELDEVFRGRFLWSTKRVALARFKRSDHFGDPTKPLNETVRDFVEQSGHARPTGPIRMLAHLRYFGYVLNPVSFFYCFDSEEALQYVVAEVTNTPWGETHCYVVSRNQFLANEAEPSSQKGFHVSPFMPMDLHYCWQLTQPHEKLTARIANFQNPAGTEEHNSNKENETEPDGQPFFDALLSLNRREISTWQLSRVLLRYPLMTAQVVTAIYWQALKLWWKGCPFYTHPNKEKKKKKKSSQKPTLPATNNETKSSNEVEIHS